MICLPSLGRAPATYTTANEDAAAARCALLLAPKGPIAPIVGRKAPVELAQLERMLHEWTANAVRDLEIFKPKLHFCVDRAPSCECCASAEKPMSLWLINRDGELWNSRWRLDRRWKELQQQAPGMPTAALAALRLASAAGLPIYTPHNAFAFCSWLHWHGEMDEKWALEEWEEGMTSAKAEAQGFPTRSWLEKKLPPLAKVHARGIGQKRLRQAWGPRRDVARAILEVLDTVKAQRNARNAPRMHREQDDFYCVGYGATVRWNEDDPMEQMYGDYVNSMFEGGNVQEHYGWFPIANPGRQLHKTLAVIEGQFKIARAAEKLIRLVAEEVR